MSITILDGGMGQELIKRSGNATGLWATQILIDNPQIVRDVHDDYFAAGAQMATTNTYAVLQDRLKAHGIEDQLEPLQRRACQMAIDARKAHGSGTVAGSLGPIGFSYQPDLAPPSEQAAEAYHEICKIQAEYVDHFIAETMASVDQARGALMGMSGHGKPIWLALSVSDADGTKLRSGEPLSDILPLLTEFNADTVLINCSAPEAVSAAIPELSKSGIPVGAYANGFVKIEAGFSEIGATVDMLETRTDLGPSAYLEFAKHWVNQGATLVGGCCEVGPAHIAKLAKGLNP